MSAPVSALLEATIDDLARVPENGKAEIVNGKLVIMSPTGFLPGRAAGKIFISLFLYERRQGGGYAISDNTGFLVSLPRRRSFSPDVAWFVGETTSGKFLNGAPAFAAEVRSENDYGARAEQEMAEKRTDYFNAGTQVVWDVDVLQTQTVRAYRAVSPDTPVIFQRGAIAHAEPAVPGWSLPVDDLFE